MTARRTGRRTLGALRLIREGSHQAPEGYPVVQCAFASAQDVFELMAPYAQREEVECIWMLPLSAQHMTLFRDPIIVSRGILNSALVHAREVFRPAIVAGAMAIIMVHNHPSGDPTPSTEDRIITSAIKVAGDHIGITLLDHIVIGKQRYVSFAEAGLL